MAVTQDASAGSTVVWIAEPDCHLKAGDTLLMDPGSPNQEEVTMAAFGQQVASTRAVQTLAAVTTAVPQSIVLQTPLKHDHPAGGRLLIKSLIIPLQRKKKIRYKLPTGPPPRKDNPITSACEACDRCYASCGCGPGTGCSFGLLSPGPDAGPSPDERFGFCCDGGDKPCPREFKMCGRPGALGFVRGALSECRDKTGTAPPNNACGCKHKPRSSLPGEKGREPKPEDTGTGTTGGGPAAGSGGSPTGTTSPGTVGTDTVGTGTTGTSTPGTGGTSAASATDSGTSPQGGPGERETDDTGTGQIGGTPGGFSTSPSEGDTPPPASPPWNAVYVPPLRPTKPCELPGMWPTPGSQTPGWVDEGIPGRGPCGRTRMDNGLIYANPKGRNCDGGGGGLLLQLLAARSNGTAVGGGGGGGGGGHSEGARCSLLQLFTAFGRSLRTVV